jgi:hypothetical protein
MNGNTHIVKRLITGLALAISLAAITVPSALAGGASRYGPPDPWALPYLTSHTKASMTQRYGPLDPWALSYFASQATPTTGLIDGRSPDTRDAAQAAQKQALVPVDGRSPDTRNAAQAAQAVQARLLVLADGRSPDTIDAALQAHSPVVTVSLSPGFQWGDFGIGVVAALGAVFLFGLSMRLLTARQSREQPSPVATA